MAQEQQELRSVNWNEVFGFTHLFKCFRMAIQPSKLALAAGALIVMFLVGWVMDQVWGGIGGQYALIGQRAGEPGEIACSAGLPAADFARWRGERIDSRLDEAVTLVLDSRANLREMIDFGKAWSARVDAQDKDSMKHAQLVNAFRKKVDANRNDFPSEDRAKVKARSGSVASLLRDASHDLDQELERIDKCLKDARDDAAKEVGNLPANTDDEKKARKEAEAALELHHALAQPAKTDVKQAFCLRPLRVKGMGISDALVAYEWNCIRAAIQGAVHRNFTGGMGQYRQRNWDQPAVAPAALSADALQVPPAVAAGAGEGGGVFYYSLMAVQGVCWVLRTHWLYAIVYLAVAMGVCALFGGAVNRIAALHFAREEKISAGQALKFALSRFVSFYTAPLIPIAIIFVVGLVLALGGFALLNVPGLDWLGGLLFVLAIAAGMGIAFLLTGLVGGFGLMYPTIAAEGSDSFDAISRSFSYVYARPWRAILYGAIAAVYGAITYLFVRGFVFVGLSATHWFLKAGVASWFGGKSLSPDADRLDLIWTAPTFDNLWGNFSWAAMDGWDKIPAFLIGAWVLVMACFVSGYLLSYAASATTVIYFLLRRKVDATDLDDVYVEEPVEPAPEPATEAAPATAAPTGEGSATPAPAAPTATAPASEAPKAPADDKPPT